MTNKGPRFCLQSQSPCYTGQFAREGSRQCRLGHVLRARGQAGDDYTVSSQPFVKEVTAPF